MAHTRSRQRNAHPRAPRDGRRPFTLRKGNTAPSQPPRAGQTPLPLPYGVRVRNTSGDPRSAWAAFAKAARTGARMTQSELARRLDVERTTVWRWETGKQRPENGDMVAAFAAVLGIDLDEALAAAGLRPGTPAPVEPTRERDEELELILAAPVDDRMKKRMIERLYELRARDKQRRMEEIQFLIDPRRRDVG